MNISLTDVTQRVSKTPLIHLAVTFNWLSWQTAPGWHSTKTPHSLPHWFSTRPSRYDTSWLDWSLNTFRIFKSLTRIYSNSVVSKYIYIYIYIYICVCVCAYIQMRDFIHWTIPLMMVYLLLYIFRTMGASQVRKWAISKGHIHVPIVPLCRLQRYCYPEWMQLYSSVSFIIYIYIYLHHVMFKYHCFVFCTNIIIHVLFLRHVHHYYWDVYYHSHSFWTIDLGFLILRILDSAIPPGIFCPWTFL